eukprot:COSAG05_NODE_11583_length_506_cov_1.012285_1_plen_94_part_10
MRHADDEGDNGAEFTLLPSSAVALLGVDSLHDDNCSRGCCCGRFCCCSRPVALLAGDPDTAWLLLLLLLLLLLDTRWSEGDRSLNEAGRCLRLP